MADARGRAFASLGTTPSSHPQSVESLQNRYGAAYKYLVTVAGMMGVMSMVLSVTIANVAVPSVMGAFGIGQDQAQWMATAFIATMTLSQLLNSWMVEAFGRRLAYLIILGVFCLGTAVSAFSTSYDLIILGRVLQGFAAGVSQPLVMVVLFQVFPDNQRGLAMGLYGMIIVLAPGLGPAVGGLAIDLFSWRHIFFVPLPLVGLAAVLGYIFMPGRIAIRPLPTFDWTGFFLAGTALVCILTGLADGQRFGRYSDHTVIRFGIGIASAVAFIVHESRTSSPLLDPTLFKSPAFASATAVAFAFGFGNMATNYAIPVFVQTVQMFTATKAGAALVPAGFILLVIFPIAGRISDFFPAYVPIMFGLVAFAVGALLLATCDINTSFWTIAIYTCIGRFGMGWIMPPLVASAMKVLPEDKLSRGSGAINFMRQLGGSVGISLIVVWMEQRTRFHADALTATQTPDNAASREMLQSVADLLAESGVSAAQQQPGALHYLGDVLAAQSHSMGFQDGFLFMFVVFVCALIPAWILKHYQGAAKSK